jgi:hypothetical protein
VKRILVVFERFQFVQAEQPGDFGGLLEKPNPRRRAMLPGVVQDASGKSKVRERVKRYHQKGVSRMLIKNRSTEAVTLFIPI